MQIYCKFVKRCFKKYQILKKNDTKLFIDKHFCLRNNAGRMFTKSI